MGLLQGINYFLVKPALNTGIGYGFTPVCIVQETLGSLAFSRGDNLETDCFSRPLGATYFLLGCFVFGFVFVSHSCFAIGSCSAAQSGLELIVLLLLSQDDRYYHILLLFCVLYFVSFTSDLAFSGRLEI